jgi:hypothetical protein
MLLVPTHTTPQKKQTPHRKLGVHALSFVKASSSTCTRVCWAVVSMAGVWSVVSSVIRCLTLKPVECSGGHAGQTRNVLAVLRPEWDPPGPVDVHCEFSSKHFRFWGSRGPNRRKSFLGLEKRFLAVKSVQALREHLSTSRVGSFCFLAASYCHKRMVQSEEPGTTSSYTSPPGIFTALQRTAEDRLPKI